MADNIFNATPRTYFRGTQDSSLKQAVAEAVSRPQHLPFFFLFAQKGPLEPQFVTGAEAAAMYGIDSFDLRKQWATHATVFAKQAIAQGGTICVQRVVSDDIPQAASLRLWADVLPVQLSDYERNADGSIKTSTTGVPVVLGTKIAGFKVKFVLDSVTAVDGEGSFGQASEAAGDLTDPDTETQSTRIPLMDFQVPSVGAFGNNNGIRLYAPTTKSKAKLDPRIVQNEAVYPFRIACVSRPDALTSPSIVSTVAGEQYIDFSFMPGSINRLVDKQLYIGDTFLDAYQDLDSGNVPAYGPFGAISVYDANIEALLTQLYTEEVKHRDAFSDFTGDPSEIYRFNLFGATTSGGVPYHAIQLISGVVGSVRLAETSNLMAQGGGDGTLTATVFDKLVKDGCAQFLDANSPLKNMIRFPFSTIYDSGFSLDTKYALVNILANRPNTSVILGTHTVGGAILTDSDEAAIAAALLTHVQQFPESEYYGTSTMRGMLIGGSGRLTAGQFRGHLPLTLEFLNKAVAYHGAADGSWKPGLAFDDFPLNKVTLFKSLNVETRSDTARDNEWDIGLVTVESSDRREYFFPAFQTVYNKDDSILNSYMAMALCQDLTMIGEEIRIEFSGKSSLSNLQFVDRMTKRMAERVLGRYDGRFTIIPTVVITAADEARGYSWTAKYDFYGPTMKTVQTLSLDGHRIEDLPA